MSGFKFSEAFPERWIHAADLGGKEVTLTIADSYSEEVRNPSTNKAEIAYILRFAELKTKREYILNVSNARVCKELWGDDSAAWTGKRITLKPVPDESGLSDDGLRIIFVASPDIEKDVVVRVGGREKTRRIRATKKAAPAKAAGDEAGDEPPGSDAAEYKAARDGALSSDGKFF